MLMKKRVLFVWDSASSKHLRKLNNISRICLFLQLQYQGNPFWYMLESWIILLELC